MDRPPYVGRGIRPCDTRWRQDMESAISRVWSTASASDLFRERPRWVGPRERCRVLRNGWLWRVHPLRDDRWRFHLDDPPAAGGRTVVGTGTTVSFRQRFPGCATVRESDVWLDPDRYGCGRRRGRSPCHYRRRSDLAAVRRRQRNMERQGYRPGRFESGGGNRSNRRGHRPRDPPRPHNRWGPELATAFARGIGGNLSGRAAVRLQNPFDLAANRSAGVAPRLRRRDERECARDTRTVL
jgi:hypothetical protein